MVKKIKRYAKFIVCMALIMGLIAPSYAALSASDGSAFVTKAEFDSALADFNARLTTFEAGINSKIDSQVTSYLDRNGIWNGKQQILSKTDGNYELGGWRAMCENFKNVNFLDYEWKKEKMIAHINKSGLLSFSLSTKRLGGNDSDIGTYQDGTWHDYLNGYAFGLYKMTIWVPEGTSLPAKGAQQWKVWGPGQYNRGYWSLSFNLWEGDELNDKKLLKVSTVLASADSTIANNLEPTNNNWAQLFGEDNNRDLVGLVLKWEESKAVYMCFVSKGSSLTFDVTGKFGGFCAGNGDKNQTDNMFCFSEGVAGQNGGCGLIFEDVMVY